MQQETEKRCKRPTNAVRERDRQTRPRLTNPARGLENPAECWKTRSRLTNAARDRQPRPRLTNAAGGRQPRPWAEKPGKRAGKTAETDKCSKRLKNAARGRQTLQEKEAGKHNRRAFRAERPPLSCGLDGAAQLTLRIVPLHTERIVFFGSASSFISYWISTLPSSSSVISMVPSVAGAPMYWLALKS